jgi:hypothetical protein
MKFVSFSNYMTIATSEADTQVLRKGKQVLLHLWHPLCYSSYKSGDIECGKDNASGTYLYSFVTHIFLKI